MFKDDLNRVYEAVGSLEWSKESWMELGHALMNIPVEATRAHPQRWTKIYLGIILLGLIMYGLGHFDTP